MPCPFCYPDRRLIMKKRMMLIINPMAGRSGYKTGFGEVMNILDSLSLIHI